MSALGGYLIIILGGGFLIWAALYFDRRGKPTIVNLLPYQRGVLFRQGKPLRDVGAGKHRVWSGTELLVHGDTRPISVNLENQVVLLQDGLAVLYGFSASAQVTDIRSAIYAARDYSQIPISILARCTRRHLNACGSGNLKTEKDAIINRIMEEAKSRLQKSGFELLSYRLGQLALGTTQPPPAEPAPRLSSSSE